VCSHLGFTIPQPACDAAAKALPMAIEYILKLVRAKIAELSEHGALQRLVCIPAFLVGMAKHIAQFS
jgi:hypothetical protein